MKWGELQQGFCEGVLSGPPEPVNAFTSLAMTFYGLAGLFVTRNHNILIKVISAMLAVTGIGSFIYHWTWESGWGLIDSIPMLITSYLGAYQALDSILYKKLVLDKKEKRKYEYASGVLIIIISAMLVMSTALSATDDMGEYFSILFAVPQILIGIAVFIIRTLSHKDITRSDNKDIYYAFRLMYIGFGIAITAAVIWFVTELNCKKPGLHWLRYLYTHGIWHISISMGMYFLLQFLVFIYHFNVGKKPSFVRGAERWYKKVFYILVPSVELNTVLMSSNITNMTYNTMV